MVVHNASRLRRAALRSGGLRREAQHPGALW
jgi:hypothetical protein